MTYNVFGGTLSLTQSINQQARSAKFKGVPVDTRVCQGWKNLGFYFFFKFGF